MRYKSVNEPDSIELHDAVIKTFEMSQQNDVLTLLVEGAVVQSGNSQNEFYTDKYSDQMQIRFVNPVIEAVLLEGHKYYDANDRLIEQVPDQVLLPEEYGRVMKQFNACYIFYAGTPKEKVVQNYTGQDMRTLAEDMKCYQMIIDVEDESYVISFYYEKVIAEWEHFLNKANV